MPSFDDDQKTEFVKGLVLGDPGAGKTGALTSLVKAGYELYIYDFDNLLAVLRQFVMKECPENRGNIHYQTFTDKLKGIDTPAIMVGNSIKINANNDGAPKAYVNALKQLTYWKVTDPVTGEVEDLGDPGQLGGNAVVVIDSLTKLSNAAFRYVQAINPLGREPQAYYHAAQQLIMNCLELLCSKDFRVHVLVNAHLSYTKKPSNPQAAADMTQHEVLELGKGFPRSVGSALNEVIGSNFNSLLLVERVNDKRYINTKSTSLVDLRNPAPFSLPDRLDISDGLARFFEAVKG